MIILKYITFENDEGNLIENKIIPTDIPKNSIHTISPMFTNRGTYFNNVTLLEDNYGKQYKIVGNYKKWIETIRPTKNKIGL